MEKSNERTLVKMLYVPMLEGIQFSNDMEQMTWYNQNIQPYPSEIYVGWEQRPSEGFEFNYQRDKFLDKRDEVLAALEGNTMVPLIRRKRNEKIATVYKLNNTHNYHDADKLAKELRDYGYEVTVEDRYPDTKIDFSESRGGASHYAAVQE